MKTKLMLCLCLLATGCNATVGPDTKPNEPTPVVQTFDTAALANALADQAALANEATSVKASEVLDGTLNQMIECGVPADFVERVRTACPAIGTPTATDLSDDQVKAIRAVR